MMILLGAFVVLAVASVVRTTAGFGFSLVAVPPLALLIDPASAVVVAGIMAAPLSLWIAVRDWRHVDRRLMTATLLSGLAGVPFGVWLLATLSSQVLMFIITAVVLLGTLIVWRKITLGGGLGAVMAVGMFSGASFAATGIDGPPMVAAFQSMKLEPRVQRATLGVVFSGTSLAALVGFGISGQLTVTVGQMLLVGVPALLIGIFVGEKAFRRLNAERFRRVVLGLLVVSSLSVVLRVATA
ncbi:sulfite exporter TauE/SafE family protein [Streptomyces virginiae]|uniref:sulfite exporter TauE/SafE family protein n=1 Tax=Streptomyces virginiae TaxID=1961 RepID=UPI002254FF3F|nr:sulfite exporter TauE/SafE family protein [Streptomyces virginiae]MCX4958363.1 sulfite exporter TauE/SafE family protein [Streptomyces virginiae]MCX5177191.1 sulfite exporter TauE/SafE family protein [Streptomyces virginiae]